MAASLDVLGYLPAPAGTSNRGAADLLDGQLLAYGASASVAVLEVRAPQLARTAPRAALGRLGCDLHRAQRDPGQVESFLSALGPSADALKVTEAGMAGSSTSPPFCSCQCAPEGSAAPGGMHAPRRP
jgi:hypothetical protein